MQLSKLGWRAGGVAAVGLAVAFGYIFLHRWEAPVNASPSLPSAPQRKIHARSAVTGETDPTLAEALRVAQPYRDQGFVVREDYWAGALPSGQERSIVHRLFRGNEYWLWAGTVEEAKISVHIYDSDGRLVESEAWQDSRGAAAQVIPKNSGTYYFIVGVDAPLLSAREIPWALAYGFR